MNKPVFASESEVIPFTIRPAEPDDSTVCALLDASYETNYVWQMSVQEGERTVQNSFAQVRLPRVMSVAYPYSEETLQTMFEQASCFYVACFYDAIIGCLSGQLEAWRNTFVIHNLIVHPQTRRRGVGKQLLRVAKNWAYENDCHSLMTLMQTKNYPAIQFAVSRGFILCGYNDKFYSNGDIALLYTLVL